MSNFTALAISAVTMLPSTTPFSLPTASIPPSICTPTPIVTTTTAHPRLPTDLIQHNSEGDCAPQPAGYGPHPTHDTPGAFYDSPTIHSLAAHAPIPQVPTEYVLAFSLAEASYSGRKYLGHFELEAYSPEACAAHCNAYGSELASPNPGLHSTTAESDDSDLEQQCKGFNIYFERSPSLRLGPECKTASSRTLIKCAIWGSQLRKQGAVNRGYKEWDFDVVIAGSNGYHLERFGGESVDETGKKGSRKSSLASRVGLHAGLVAGAFFYGIGMIWITWV
ncbi:hypothetical protein P3342_006316 [Pyrenophora teres f. teres]|uniref:Uncharacterized protein n=1 Tax=Pyrenophora teres f. teres TaxID=97479 RepID=A0A6S6VZ96_9PLEO|nr:hypothetical protein PTNB85_04521 [Pyrenophora teres f. teres]KAE8848741.1 hypothetical protein HRS9122_02757 [Pyrenophora teres f. teres]KAE8864618.1 hypothetical protein PTNB29_04582 [Pyrenophora teres f. teres]KAK1907128.1 hypothetical protein P3342_006316 [Pyrenophora teres f. teres]CAE7030428.1 hypothetical protein PTTW11_04522 [Pyrenophora teres f. teres]